MQKPENPGRRLARFLPVLVIVTIAVILYGVYVVFHCLPMLQVDIPAEFRDDWARNQGIVRLVVSHLISAMLFWSFYQTYVTNPGEVPATEEWKSRPNRDKIRERKRDGSLRYCNKCGHYKPDRSHHSSNTGRCVLKMDHYCPWVANDVGHFNYKFFYLTLLYGTIDLVFVAATIVPTVGVAVSDPNIPFEQVYFIFLGAALSIFVLAVVGPFWVFHSWLITRNATTIEYCEKRRGGVQHDYNAGLARNLTAILGENVATWLLPVGGPSGDGLSYEQS